MGRYRWARHRHFSDSISFLGLIGGRELPGWVLRHLRYVAVAVMPALVSPPVVWPTANGGEPEPSRLLAALAVLI
jgi:branched-subunit amino acid transport protein